LRGLAAFSEGKGKGDSGGGGGSYIAAEGALVRQGLKGIEEGSNLGRRFPVREEKRWRRPCWQVGPTCRPEKGKI
jgi:hypothetical protein